MSDQADAVHPAELKAVQADIAEIKSTLKDVAGAMISIARSEERLANLQGLLKEVSDRVGLLEVRTSTLESLAPLNGHMRKWVDRFLWLVVGGACTAGVNLVVG